MPRYRSDSDPSDYSSRGQRSPRRRSPTPGPRRPRDLSPDHHPRFQLEPHTPFYPVASGAAGPGPGNRRPRSAEPSTETFTAATTMAPAQRRRGDRSYDRSSYSSASDSDGDDRHHEGRRRALSDSPLHKARSLLSSTFTPSTSGLGVGVLGAIVGGLAAREASEAVAHRQHHHGGRRHGGRNKDRRPRDHHLLSTVVGAAVGGLGANALEKRIEASRERNEERERESHGDGGVGRRGSGEGRRY